LIEKLYQHELSQIVLAVGKSCGNHHDHW